MEPIQLIFIGTAVFIISMQAWALKKLSKITKREIDAHADTLDRWRACVLKQKELLEKENYLIKAINDSMQVTYPKGFLIQRMKRAPFESIDPKRIRRDLIDEPK